jgi:hypothetical protein
MAAPMNVIQLEGTMTAPYDRTTQDAGNIVALEHINLAVADQKSAIAFYVMGMGFTRDPYISVGLDNMWINVGRSQFHLPTTGTQRLCGTIGVVVPDLAELTQRLDKIAPWLANTQYRYHAQAGRVDVICPWGNRFRCHAPDPGFGIMDLGIPYLEFDVSTGAADGIARFYRDGLNAATAVERHGDTVFARVMAGTQKLLFRETADPITPYDGHHIQIYIADFSGPHRFLSVRGLVTQESNATQYRFCDIVDPATGKVLHKIEHEVRSLSHPLYGRPLINRNPAQGQGRYMRGQDAFRGTY